MLPLTVVLEIRRLLSESELSQRAIAARMGVARDTVRAIASGRRNLDSHTADRGRTPRRYYVKPLTVPQRCPGCGGLVHMPCRLCRVRDYQRRHELIRRLPLVCANPKSAA
jgi:hypothetical protein